MVTDFAITEIMLNATLMRFIILSNDLIVNCTSHYYWQNIALDYDTDKFVFCGQQHSKDIPLFHDLKINNG